LDVSSSIANRIRVSKDGKIASPPTIFYTVTLASGWARTFKGLAGAAIEREFVNLLLPRAVEDYEQGKQFDGGALTFLL
jgi:hypothetical protein